MTDQAAESGDAAVQAFGRGADPDGDGLWLQMQAAAAALAAREPCWRAGLKRNVLGHERLADALAFRLADKLASTDLPSAPLREQLTALLREASIERAAWCDLLAVMRRDPACTAMPTPLLHYSGYLALQAHRAAHAAWGAGRRQLALHLQSRCSQQLGVDIHPAARIGCHVMLDHAIGIVIGETAVIEDDVSMLHGVTLGARRSASGDRHPKVRRGAWLGAGAQLLGNIEIGAHSRVGAGSVVLCDVPPFCTVVGVPARIVNRQELAEARCEDQVV